MEDRQIKSGDFYQHFKGMLYQVIGVAKHSETREEMVVYQALYGDYSLYVRPLAMFLSVVDKEKYPDVTCIYRFTKIERSQLQNGSLQKTEGKSRNEHANFEATTDTTVSSVKATEESKGADHNHDLVNSDLMAFLDARDCGEKLEVLYSIRKKIDDRMLSDIEMSLDLPVGTDSIEQRLAIVRDNLQTMAKYEGRRLR